jgi:beta-glucosidase
MLDDANCDRTRGEPERDHYREATMKPRKVPSLVLLILASPLALSGCEPEEVEPYDDTCAPDNLTGDCDAGETCFEGACIDASELCSLTNEVGLCDDATTCFSGACVTPTVLCSETVTDGLCELGNTCFDGACVQTASLCSSSNVEGTCTDGLVCLEGICGPTPLADPCEQYVYTVQPTIGAHTAVTGKGILTKDGLQFKDSDGSGAVEPYEDWRLLEECRAKDLVSRMDLDQKLGTMRESSLVGNGTADGTIPDNIRVNLIDNNYRYTLIRLGSRSAQELAVYLNNVQELVEAQPLGIPVTVTADPVHGFGMSTHGTTGAQSINSSSIVTPWPYPLGLGAANDLALSRAYGDTVREEFKAMGFRWQLGPMGDSATEPRWARVQNTFGENPHAAALHTKMVVAGFQGQGDGGLPNGIAATMKHWPGAGANEDGMDSHSYPGRFNVYPGGWFELHQIPFQAAVDVDVAAVMPCYSVYKDQFEYDPTQVSAGFSYELMTEYLREDIGFKGMVTGDWGTIGHGYNTESLSTPQRAAMWIQAGSHQFGSDNESSIRTAYEQGLITEEEIDGAVQQIVEMTFELGLFENPYVDPAAVGVRSPENLTVGFEAQKKAIVLLDNRAHEFVPQSGGGSDPAPRYLPIDGTRYRDANSNSLPDPGEYIDDADDDGIIEVYFDGVVDGIVADPTRPDPVTEALGEYVYTSEAATGKLAVTNVTDIALADIAILRITARKGVYFGLDAGVPLSFDGAFPGTSTDSTIGPALRDRDRVLRAFRVRDGYTDSTGEPVAATNPDLKIVLVMHMDRPGIVEPFIQGMATLDELPGVPGSFPLVSDPANIDPTGLSGVDAFLVEFGAYDRAVLDFLFNVDVPEGWTYGRARLPMEIPRSDAAVEAQFEDVPNDSGNPTFRLGSGSTY